MALWRSRGNMMDDAPFPTPDRRAYTVPMARSDAPMPATAFPAGHYWTADDVRALPDDGNRYECVDGVLLVTPSPRARHQRAVQLLGELLSGFARAQGVGELLPSPADIELERDHLVQPDLFVCPLGAGGRVIMDWAEVRRLLLAVEVLSPSSARFDRGLKREFYLRAPVDEYWIVDVEGRTVEVWQHGDARPQIVTGGLDWSPEGASGALPIDLEELFARVNGER